MADRTIPAHPVRDPDCDLWKTRPGHVCRRRDGLLLTGTNGDCHAHAVEHARSVGHMLDELAVAGYPHPDDDLADCRHRSATNEPVDWEENRWA
jgi:hypothetical protein